jgi:hypothetical protein
MHRALPASLTLLLASLAQAQWSGPTGAQNLVSYTNGNVYVGTAGSINPVVRFDVVDNAQTSRVIGIHSYIGTPQNSVRTTAIWGETNNPEGRALQGFNFSTSGNGAGIWAETASSQGYGLRARATSTSGLCYGAYFDNASPIGYGVYSEVTSSSGTPIALYGRAAGSTGWAGFFSGRGYFSGNVGIGTANTTRPLNVVGNDSTTVILSTNSSNTGGSAVSAPGAVIGQMTATGGGSYSAGVRAYNSSLTSSGCGLVAYHGGSGFGVYATTAEVSGVAGWFDGQVQVNGTLAKGGGSFKIDHPLDPENKYLYHSFVESPDMMNIYNGLTTTDEQGYATITLPEWFDTLNRDFRYQLTVIDESDSGWTLAKVVRKMVKNQFTIRTNYPNIEVSWQVTGIRQDNFANANRIPVEVEKEAHNKGRYVHPAAFGKSRDLAVTHQVDAQGRAVPAITEKDIADMRKAAREAELHNARESAAQVAARPGTTTAAQSVPPLTPAIRGGR